MKWKTALLLLLNLFYSFSFGQNLYKVKLEGAINPIAVELLKQSLEMCKTDSSSAILIELDTPGGLMSSTRMIVKDFLSFPQPIIVYVAPSGARAGSAGVFITLASHIAAMAPATNIGAAHPVSLGGAMDTSQVMATKIINDAVASIKSIARERKRNIEWAESAVRESASITAHEALDLNVIDIIAKDENELLTKANKIWKEKFPEKSFDFTGLNTIDIEKNWRQKILDVIADPSIAYMLLLLGIYGLLFEFYNPGAIIPAVVGVISIILAFFAMQTLPVNAAGIMLIILAFIFFILEVKIISYGILTIGGIVSFFLGSVMLFDPPIPEFKLPWGMIITATIFTTLFMLFAIGLAIKAQSKKVTTGKRGMVDEQGKALANFKDGEGNVAIHGEIWAAVSQDKENINKNDIIEVCNSAGLKLIVKKVVREA